MAVTYSLQTSSVTDEPMITQDQKTLTIFFLLVLTGNYTTGGITIDLTQLFALAAGGPGSSLPTGALPLLPLELESSRSVAQANEYIYHYVPGTTPSNGTLQIFTGAAAQTGLTELAAGALPAGVTGDTIAGRVTFPKL